MTRLLVLLYIPTKYYQNISKGIEVMERTMMRLRTDGRTDGWTDGRHTDRYIPRTYRTGDNRFESAMSLAIYCELPSLAFRAECTSTTILVAAFLCMSEALSGGLYDVSKPPIVSPVEVVIFSANSSDGNLIINGCYIYCKPYWTELPLCPLRHTLKKGQQRTYIHVLGTHFKERATEDLYPPKRDTL